MECIEVSAKTVDDAITKACIELQAASDKLEIQVIRGHAKSPNKINHISGDPCNGTLQKHYGQCPFSAKLSLNRGYSGDTWGIQQAEY